MKIVTINCPESYLEAIKKLVGKKGLYPSRSELIREAVKHFLLRELKKVKNRRDYVEYDLDEKQFVRVPIERKNENGDKVQEFKTYKILKKLV